MATDEYGLTTNQRAFADEYIANKGNATQAYLKAYPSVKSADVAKVGGSRLLTKDNVSAYIAERTDEVLAKAKMTGDEIIATLTSIARREMQESYSSVYNHLTGETEKELTYTFQPNVEEATKATELLAKFKGIDNPNNKLQIKRLELEIEKLQQQIGGNETQDDKIASYISDLQEAFKHGAD